MSTHPYLVMIDLATTNSVTFQGGAGAVGNYPLFSGEWTPSICGLRDSPFDGQGPYTDVIEEILVNITDTTAAGCYTRLATLNRLLEQAQRYIDGGDQSPVEIKFSPTGGTVSDTTTPMRALVLGPAPGDQSGLGTALSADFDKASFTFNLRARVRFWRRGAWRISSVVDSSSATTQGDIASIAATGGALSDYSPVKISFTNGVFYTGCKDGFLLLHDDADGITIINAESLADAGVYTSVTDAGDFPRNTNILRYTPGVTTPVDTAGAAFTTSGKRLLVFINARNNSTTADYYVKAKVKATRNIETPEKLIPANATPFSAWYCLGMISAPAVPSGLSLTITASATGAGTLDIDTIVTLDIEDPAHAAIQLGWDDNVNASSGSTVTVGCDPGYIDARRPSTSGSGFLYRKTDIAFWSKAATMYALWLKSGTLSDVEDWRTNSTGSVVTNTFTLTRYPVYLTPQ